MCCTSFVCAQCRGVPPYFLSCRWTWSRDHRHRAEMHLHTRHSVWYHDAKNEVILFHAKLKYCEQIWHGFDRRYKKINKAKWTKITNLRRRRPPFWISFIAHNSFTIAHICKKFGTCITLEVLHAGIPNFWTEIKSKMMAAILDFCTIAITQPPIDIN